MTTNSEKIDIVYTWVDGSDPEWLEKKCHYLQSDKKYHGCKKDQVSQARYSDNQELLYSLRSLEYFAPWINHIFIVTDKQKPSWLKECDHITVIDHTEIISAQYLPTFNSSVIEAHLHNIPNLSEKFIYFNDDMLLGRKSKPSDFFKNDKPKVFTSSLFPTKKKVRNKENATYNMLSIQHSRQLAGEQTGKVINLGLKHGVRPLIKSRLKDLYSLYTNITDDFFSDRFRSKPFSFLYFYTFYELASKNAAPQYMQTLKKRSKINVFPGFIYVNRKNIASFSDNFNKIRPLVFCINDTPCKLSEIYLFSKGYFSKKGSSEND